MNRILNLEAYGFLIQEPQTISAALEKCFKVLLNTLIDKFEDLDILRTDSTFLNDDNNHYMIIKNVEIKVSYFIQLEICLKNLIIILLIL